MVKHAQRSKVVGLRLTGEDVEALQAWASAFGGNVSEAIRVALLGGTDSVPVIPLEYWRLDRELAQIDAKAESEALFAVSTQLGRLKVEGVKDLKDELESLRRQIADPNCKNKEPIRRRIAELEELIPKLEVQVEQAKAFIREKRAELLKKKGLEVLRDVSGGGLERALQAFLQAKQRYDRAAERYKFVSERSDQVLEAKAELDEARDRLERLLTIYREALEARKRAQEERKAFEEQRKVEAQAQIRPLAEDVFQTFQELRKTLASLIEKWAEDPDLARAIELAQKLNSTRQALSSAITQAGERDQRGRPSLAALELLSTLRERFKDDGDPDPEAIELVEWVIRPCWIYDSDGLPTCARPPDKE